MQATLYREVDDNLKTQATQLLNSPYASEFAIEPIVTADSLKILNPNLTRYSSPATTSPAAAAPSASARSWR